MGSPYPARLVIPLPSQACYSNSVPSTVIFQPPPPPSTVFSLLMCAVRASAPFPWFPFFPPRGSRGSFWAWDCALWQVHGWRDFPSGWLATFIPLSPYRSNQSNLPKASSCSLSFFPYFFTWPIRSQSKIETRIVHNLQRTWPSSVTCNHRRVWSQSQNQRSNRGAEELPYLPGDPSVRMKSCMGNP